MAKGLHRSSPVVLTIVGAVGLVIGRSIRPVVESAGNVAPTVPWAAPFTLLFLAGVLAWLAWTTYQNVHKETGPVRPERAVRLLALAKASALVGAAIAGYYLGFGLSFVGDLDVGLPRERVIRSAIACVAAIVALVAALLLERACEVPKPPDDSEPQGSR